MKDKYKVCSLFAGIGGIDLAFQQAGFEIVWANEIDKNACKTYRYNLPDTVLTECDIRKISADDISKMKRSLQKVPKPVRLPNNMPFDSVSTIGAYSNKVIPYIHEESVRFKHAVPGLCSMASYDYINGYIYIMTSEDTLFKHDNIIIKSAFENPTEIQLGNKEVDGMDVIDDENEWVISEDMLGQLKEIIYKRDMLTQIRETNEIPKSIEF